MLFLELTFSEMNFRERHSSSRTEFELNMPTNKQPQTALAGAVVG